VVSSGEEVDPYLARGDVRLALVIPGGYGRDLRNGGAPARVQIIADGTDSNSTTVALGYANTLVAQYGAAFGAETRAATGGSVMAGGLDAEVRVWFNPELESRMFMVPGVLALLLLVITSNLSSMGIVREKEVGTLEQLNVTPLARWQLIVGKLVPYGALGILDVLLVLSVALLWFEIPLRGSLTLLMTFSLFYLLCTLGLGLLVSTISATQQQAMMTVVFFFLLPMVYLSGFIFPIENMPRAIQPITYLIPLRYYLTVVRGVFLKGVGADVLWPQGLALIVWGTAVLLLAILRMRKRID
jgi:ABC-2 type transport system permease protein